MTASLRLDETMERELERQARAEGKSKSELIRELIAGYLKKRSEALTAWELGKEVFGREGSGRGNLSTDRKRLLKEKLRGKKRRG